MILGKNLEWGNGCEKYGINCIIYRNFVHLSAGILTDWTGAYFPCDIYSYALGLYIGLEARTFDICSVFCNRLNRGTGVFQFWSRTGSSYWPHRWLFIWLCIFSFACRNCGRKMFRKENVADIRIGFGNDTYVRLRYGMVLLFPAGKCYGGNEYLRSSIFAGGFHKNSRSTYVGTAA